MKKWKGHMISLFKVFMSPEIDKPLLDVLHSGYIGQGKKVDEFEEVLKEYFHSDYLLTLNTGTSGLHLIYHMLKTRLNLNDQSEVLATPMTCSASNYPILLNNLKLKWVDIDPKNMNIDLDDLQRKITNNTKIISFTHWGGYPVNLTEVERICDDTEKLFGFRPIVVEDCAHALGAEYNGKKLGSHGNICMYSLQAIKHVTAIDGGFVIFQNAEDYKRAKLLRWYGMNREINRLDMRCLGDVEESGFKFNMNDANATIGIINFKHLDEIVARHRENAEYYNRELQDIPGVTLLETHPMHNGSYWLYTMYVENRDGFIAKMKERGVMCSQVHERNDRYTCTKEFICHLPGYETIAKNHVCIPVGWWVTDEDREYIVKSIKEGW